MCQRKGEFLFQRYHLFVDLFYKLNLLIIPQIVQKAGQFVVTWPMAYHAGYSTGTCVGDSVNFITKSGLDYIKFFTPVSPYFVDIKHIYVLTSLQCHCDDEDTFKLNGDCLFKRYRPETYNAWLAGEEFGVHPEDPSGHMRPATVPDDSFFGWKEHRE